MRVTEALMLFEVSQMNRRAISNWMWFGFAVLWGLAPNIAIAAPTALEVPAISDTSPRDRDVLTGYSGRWVGANPISFRYQWLLCDAQGKTCRPITGATRQTFRVPAHMVGQRLRLEVVASSASGSTRKTSRTTAIIKAMRPSNYQLPIISGVPLFGRILQAAPGTWSGTPVIRYHYRWKRCDPSGKVCDSIPDATLPTYKVQLADALHSIRVAVTAINAGGESAAWSLATRSVGPISPQKLSDPAISDMTPRDGDVLTAYSGSWHGTMPITYHYQWLTCESLSSGCNKVSQGSQFFVTPDLIGKRLRIRITVRNPGGTRAVYSVRTAPVKAHAPTNDSMVRITGVPRDGGAMHADRGRWIGTAPLFYKTQWQRCDELGRDCVTILGANQATYRPTPADVAHTLRAAVTASNVAGLSSSVSLPTAQILAAPPRRLSSPVLTGLDRVGIVLQTSLGTWSGTQPFATRYQWLRCDINGENCAPISGATEATYMLSSSDRGRRVRAQVTVQNSSGSATGISWSSGVVGVLGDILFSDQFGNPAKLVTQPRTSLQEPDQPLSPKWAVTSGQVTQQSGMARVGNDDVTSAKTRAHIEGTFGDVAVSFRFRVLEFFQTSVTPTEDWDGVHLLVRYIDQTELYAVSVNRRDETVQIKKKCPGGATNHGTYYRLSAKPARRVPVLPGQWREVVVLVRNQRDGRVLIDATIDGELIESIVDDGVGCAPIAIDGSVGIRGDNVEFDFDDLEVRGIH